MIFNASFITAILCMALSVNAAPASYDNKYSGVSGGFVAITNPALTGVVDPSTVGAGRGVAGAASGTQQTADLLGDAADTLMHTYGGILGNAEQGVGVAAANSAPVAQGTVSAIQANSGIVGDVAKVLGGR